MCDQPVHVTRHPAAFDANSFARWVLYSTEHHAQINRLGSWGVGRRSTRRQQLPWQLRCVGERGFRSCLEASQNSYITMFCCRLTLQQVESSALLVFHLVRIHARICLDVELSTGFNTSALALLLPCHPTSYTTHPLGKLNSRSLCGPSSKKLATRNQLTPLSPFASLGPELTPSAYRTISLPLAVGNSSGVSARRPISCIFARGRGAVVEKARAARSGWKRRRDCIFDDVTLGLEMVLNVAIWEMRPDGRPGVVK